MSARHGAVQVDRLIRERAQLRQHALRLAERIAEQRGRDAALPIRVPPAHDLLDHLRRGRPPIDRQGERGLADEHVALELLERRAGRVRLPLVVPGHDPHLALVLDAHLRGAENVPGGMQRHLGRPDRERRAVLDRRDGVAAAEPMPGDGDAGTCENVARAAVAEMIPMRVRDERRLHRLPGVDVEIPRRAVQAAVRADDERCGVDCMNLNGRRLRRGARCDRCNLPAAVRERRADD